MEKKELKVGRGSDVYMKRAVACIERELETLAVVDSRQRYPIAETFVNSTTCEERIFKLHIAKVNQDPEQLEQALTHFYLNCAAWAKINADQGWLWWDVFVDYPFDNTGA